jgi:hypothetical protein
MQALRDIVQELDPDHGYVWDETLGDWVEDTWGPEAVAMPALRFQDKPSSSATRRRRIAEWIAQLEAAGVLGGYDRNVLAQWERSGFAGPSPTLSLELQTPYADRDRQAKELAQRSAAAQELRALNNWLEQGQRLQAKAFHEQLLKEYPISYPAFLEEQRQERMRQEQEQARLREEARLARDRELQAEQELRELQEQMEADRRELDRKVKSYIDYPLAADFELTEGEFNYWCDQIATPEQMEAVAKALQDARDFHAKPAWYRWLHTFSTELVSSGGEP